MVSSYAVARLLVSARRYRGLLIGLTLLLTITLGLVLFALHARHKAEAVLQANTQMMAALVSEQMEAALASRRAIVRLLRDSLDKTPDLSPEHMLALSAATSKQLPDLVGLGIVRQQEGKVIWWHGPERFNAAATGSLRRQLLKAVRGRRTWRQYGTHILRPTYDRTLLVLAERLQNTPAVSRFIVGAFELRQLLTDFFRRMNLDRGYRVQLWDDKQLLYASAGRGGHVPEAPVSAGNAIEAGGRTWRLVIWPVNDQAVRTLQWLRVSLIILSVTAALGILGIIWLLITRAHVLSREVDKRTEALRQLARRLHTQATTDELTGTYNRRFILDHLSQECERSKRYGRPLSCLMIDVNGFKQVNDTFGHHVGDMILKQVVQELRERLRESDVLARLGGDEFVVALPETDRIHARRVAQKLSTLPIQGAVPAHRPYGPVGLGTPSVSLSVGVGTLKAGQTPEALLAEADKELYEAKRIHLAETRGLPAAPARPVR